MNESTLCAQLRFARARRRIFARDITPFEDRLQDAITVLYLTRDLDAAGAA